MRERWSYSEIALGSVLFWLIVAVLVGFWL